MENLEKNIKDKLQHNEININTDELWNEVYPRIKPKRNRKVLFFILTGVLWISSLFVVGYYFQSDDKKEVAELNVIAKEKENNKPSGNITTQEVNQVGKLSELHGSNNQKSSKENKAKQVPSELDKKKTKKVTQDLGLSSTTKGSVLKPKNRIHNENTINAINKRQAINDQLDKVKTSLHHTLIAKEDSRSSIVFEKSDDLIIQNSKIPDSRIDEVDRIERNWPATFLNDAIPNLEFEYPQPNIPNDFYAAHEDPNSFSKLSVYLRGGVSSISRSLTARENMTSLDLQQRATAESPLESFTGELGISYQLRPNLSISAGINYNRINEQIQDSYSVTDTVLLENVIIENIISSRGSEPVFGNIESARTVSTNLTAYNRYSDIALSLDLTYLLRTQGAKPYVTVGVQQSISSSQSGYWLINDNDLYDLSQDPNSYLSSSYGLGLRLGAGVDLDLSDRSSLRIGGKYTKYLNSITSDAYSLKQKYNLLGLSAGLNIKI